MFNRSQFWNPPKPTGPLARLGLAVFVLGIVAPLTPGQPPPPRDWPHIRGPNYDAISQETDLADTWPAAGPPILWTRTLGQGYSGFVIGSGRLFTQYQTTTGMFVVAMEPDTGEEIWTRRVDWPWQAGGMYPGPYATPTWNDGRVYYVTPAGTVGCLDSATGREIWTLNVREKYEGRGIEFGFAATPLVEDGRVILPVGGESASLVALDAHDGRPIWTAGSDPASYCPAYPITLAGRRVIIAFLQNVVVAHDPVTGERIWRQRMSSHYDEHSAWPLYAEPRMMFASPFRVGAQSFHLEFAGSKLTAKAGWSSGTFSNDVCSSVLVDGSIYGFDLLQNQASTHRPSRGRFKCLDFSTGQLRWETEEVGQCSILVADRKLYLLDETGRLILARISSETFQELARAKVLDGGLGWTPPVIGNGRLFARNHKSMVCVYVGHPDSLDPGRVVRAASEVVLHEPNWTLASILTREPDFPNDAPSGSELARWFAWCLAGVLAPAILAAVITSRVARWLRRRRPDIWAAATFWIMAFVMGCAGTSVFSMWADRFVLTWPVCLYLGLRGTVAVGVWTGQQTRSRWPRLLARLVLLSFLGLCLGYYRLCIGVGYVMAWGFLGGFLPAIPFVVLASRTNHRGRRWFLDAIAFTVYFWTSGLIPAWKAAIQ